MKHLQFVDKYGSFTMENPENISYLYFPLASEAGLKSSITPNLGGDAKLNQDTFLLEPVSSENLHNNRSVRNFWCVIDGIGTYSVSGTSPEQEAAKFSDAQDKSKLDAGFMWHTIERTSDDYQLTSTVTSFVPSTDNVEIMYVVIQNHSEFPKTLTSYAAIPIYGRSADNLRDHRHVTSLLHRIRTTENGIQVCPAMSFDERGHQRNHRIYYVSGCTGNGTAPVSFYPSVEDFIGEGGTYTRPRAVYEQYPGCPSSGSISGKEAMGAFRFENITLKPGEKAEYIILIGTENNETDIQNIYRKYNSSAKVLSELERTKEYWKNQVNVAFHTGNNDFDCLMKWISFQPFLRRLFGCSFLPHHDYGRGGRGWRDLWQDCLSLLLMDPENVGEMITKNYGGVRVDGTNATIIGDGDGHFIADRNGIARVWMDHALWPLMTTKLYIDQTGDIEILNKQVPYFKDAQTIR
ncbi:MAG: cellobiose phosphorylase, partial [Lachnoclostridium sp.]|nr:cellobiose phosphorylase [Lachnoclostridium sp.]